MQYRQLGRTDLQASPLCLGSMLFGGKTAAEAHTIIDAALFAGINLINTANVNGWGQSEEVVGTALKRNGKRSQVVLSTNVWAAWLMTTPTPPGIIAAAFVNNPEASLRRLQTDYIDVSSNEDGSADFQAPQYRW